MEIRKLNSLRALAALIVFFTHFSDITHWLNGSLGGGSGAYGVMLFFLLSGFLMSLLYLDTKFSRANIERYLLARAGRILPLYLVIVFSSYLLTQNNYDILYNMTDLNSLIGHLLFIHGKSVLWTIPPEIQFYIIFIAFWFLAGDRKGYIYLLIVAFMMFWYLADFPRLFGEIESIPYNLFSTLRTFPYFFIGVIFGLHYKSLKVPSYMKSNWFILALCLIPLLYPDFSPVNEGDKKRMWLSYEVLFVMSTVFFCVVFLVPNNNIFLANKIGDFLGKVSYSFYLLHLPIIGMVNKFNLDTELKLLLSLSLSVFFAHISYVFFERPIANRIRSFSNTKRLNI
ncbi:acyltransferase family protein [Pseudoalteromonas tunicata]|jgi:peptidoglycan/LPS O-acetylase OafA/YrhL|uniref:Acyltransferase, putative n=1 Tax=Pseudoalteromonas tunicata D2 TaxID=87626 RepID=A4C5X4_9GAMM|nr:acyltransferase [Pseudoalteromonas tunicata]ATC95352.1 hypothetical protein PTUN_a2953 [Pseudoalteromonas tunicata]AXT30941.1 acyltransferase [Pseudoalteromonas tunicata]EAR29378.1 acyltransferase, putative [Pseudoalteromonas tunicata D2]